MKRRRGRTDTRSTRWSRADADDAASAAARERVAAVLEGVSRVNLGVVVVAPPDATRMAARRAATSAAVAAGRGALLDDATAATRDGVLKSFAGAGFSGTWAATEMSMSVASPADRLSAAAAFEEASMAAVVEDLGVDDETLDVLRSTSLELTGLGGLPMPGSLSSITTFASVRGPLQAVILAAFVLAIVAIAFTASVGVGLIVLALGAALTAALSRHFSQPVP